MSVRMTVGWVGLVAMLALAGRAEAQDAPKNEAPAGDTEQAAPVPEPPARGPADLIRRANAPRPAERLQQRAGGNPHGGADMMRAPRMAAASPDGSLPVGTIEVEVTDMSGRPVAGAQLELGIMSSAGGRNARDQKRGTTDAEGHYTFSGLPTGSAQAYRVNLPYEGAKVSSTPFRLPPRGGYRVRLQKRPVTDDPRMVFQMLGQSMVELRQDRLHVTQQSRLVNAGTEIYVFPEGGQFVPLPEGYISPQFQEVMTDQRLTEKEGEGFVVQGSLPPGTVTLSWTYDVTLDGSEAKLPLQFPWRTINYRVISDAPDGLELDVTGMPEPEKVNDRGRSLWITQLQQRPSDKPLQAWTIKLDGIPAPGPGRWVALALALLAVIFGAWAVIQPGEGDALRREHVKARRAQLLEQVRDLDDQKEKGDIGPEYHKERVDELTNALAVVLRDEQILEQRA